MSRPAGRGRAPAAREKSPRGCKGKAGRIAPAFTTFATSPRKGIKEIFETFASFDHGSGGIPTLRSLRASPRGAPARDAQEGGGLKSPLRPPLRTVRGVSRRINHSDRLLILNRGPSACVGE